MGVRLLPLMLLVGIVVGPLGCSKKEPSATTTKPATPPKPQVVVGEDGRLDPNDPRHGTRRLMGLDTPVYLDGEQIAVLRAGELPPIPVRPLEGGGKRYKVYDYLKGIGVDTEALRSVHFHGNRDRIGSIEGTELRAEKDRFEFSFSSGDTGAPLRRWDTDGLRNEFVVHEIRRMTIYVTKPSPEIHPQKQCHVGPDGDCTSDIPYGTGHVVKGTRIYADGKMIGFVKRRNMKEAIMAGRAAADPTETKYSLAKLVSSMGKELGRMKTVELVAGDEVIARGTGEQLAALATKTTFTLPRHGHGKIRIFVPAEIQAPATGATGREALISSVLLYDRTEPTAHRELVPISEDTDLSVQLAVVDDARETLGRGEQ